MMGGGDMAKLKAMGAPGAAPDPKALEEMAAKLGGKLPGMPGLGGPKLPGLGGGLPPGFNPFKK
jgi:signal recognition particle subunit SRP54